MAAPAGRPSRLSPFPVPVFPVKRRNFTIVYFSFPHYPWVLPWVFWGLRDSRHGSPQKCWGTPHLGDKVAPKADGQRAKPESWALFNSQFLKTLISSWLCSACFCFCSVINMYLRSHVLIQKHDKYLSFDIVSKDIYWSIYHIHPWRNIMPYSSFTRKKSTRLFASKG